MRCTALGRSLSEADAAELTPTCPAWSTKDVLAHMAGVCADILDRNTEGAATEAWADAHVEQRQPLSLAEVLHEWDERGPVLEEVIEHFAEGFPPQFYLDAWTHEWDVRQAIGERAAAVPDMRFIDDHLPWLADLMVSRSVEAGLPAIEIGRHGDGTAPRLDVSDFDLMRVSMGRRSRTQIDALEIVEPDGTRRSAAAYADTIVAWSINPLDIVDPVLPA